jgi:hypothetical protein
MKFHQPDLALPGPEKAAPSFRPGRLPATRDSILSSSTRSNKRSPSPNYSKTAVSRSNTCFQPGSAVSLPGDL